MLQETYDRLLSTAQLLHTDLSGGDDEAGLVAHLVVTCRLSSDDDGE